MAEVTSRSPSSILTGFQLGTAIRRMRGKETTQPSDGIDATLTDGILYIKNAPAVLNDGELEVG